MARPLREGGMEISGASFPGERRGGVVHGFSTVESSINSYKPQKCGIFLSNFIFLYVACVACLWYNGLEVIMIEALF